MFGDISDEEQEKRMREKLSKMVDAGLLKKLIPRMVDPLKMVRLYAVGALRNMSVTGGLEICEVMTTQNVITPLVKIISETAQSETFEKNDLHLVQVLEQAVALLSNLCESCQAAINELTQGQLLEPIMLIAAKGKAHASLHLETLKLLLLITESNPRLNEVFGASAAYQTVLGEIIQSEQLSLLVRLHAVGIAMNVRAIMEAEANVARLLPVVEAALAYDAASVLQLAQNVSEQYELSQKSVLVDEDVDDDTITDEDRQQVTNAQLKYRSWRDAVQTLSLALELVAELAVGGEDGAFLRTLHVRLIAMSGTHASSALRDAQRRTRTSGRATTKKPWSSTRRRRWRPRARALACCRRPRPPPRRSTAAACSRSPWRSCRVWCRCRHCTARSVRS